MKRTLIFVILGIAIIAACVPAASADIVGAWELVSYGDPAGPTPAAPDVETSIEFKSAGTLAGNVGCNGFGGDYTVSDGTIEFGSIVSTLMFCEGPAGEQETVTLKVFSETASYVLEGNTLTITSADGNAVVVLSRK